MSERYFVDSPIVGGSFTLAGDEGEHLVRVMRAKVGESVVLFDGQGNEWDGTISCVSKSAATITVDPPRSVNTLPATRIVLAVALPKGERQKWLIEKVTELGAAAIVPLITERGVAQPTDSALERLSRSALEACKQCNRSHLLEIREPQTITGLLSTSSSEIKIVADPSGTAAFSSELVIARLAAAKEAIIAIGPEGGFSPAELTQFTAADWNAVALGKQILRVETAAIAFTALLASLPE